MLILLGDYTQMKLRQSEKSLESLALEEVTATTLVYSRAGAAYGGYPTRFTLRPSEFGFEINKFRLKVTIYAGARLFVKTYKQDGSFTNNTYTASSSSLYVTVSKDTKEILLDTSSQAGNTSSYVYVDLIGIETFDTTVHHYKASALTVNYNKVVDVKTTQDIQSIDFYVYKGGSFYRASQTKPPIKFLANKNTRTQTYNTSVGDGTVDFFIIEGAAPVQESVQIGLTEIIVREESTEVNLIENVESENTSAQLMLIENIKAKDTANLTVTEQIYRTEDKTLTIEENVYAQDKADLDLRVLIQDVTTRIPLMRARAINILRYLEENKSYFNKYIRPIGVCYKSTASMPPTEKTTITVTNADNIKTSETFTGSFNKEFIDAKGMVSATYSGSNVNLEVPYIIADNISDLYSPILVDWLTNNTYYKWISEETMLVDVVGTTLHDADKIKLGNTRIPVKAGETYYLLGPTVNSLTVGIFRYNTNAHFSMMLLNEKVLANTSTDLVINEVIYEKARQDLALTEAIYAQDKTSSFYLREKVSLGDYKLLSLKERIIARNLIELALNERIPYSGNANIPLDLSVVELKGVTLPLTEKIKIQDKADLALTEKTYAKAYYDLEVLETIKAKATRDLELLFSIKASDSVQIALNERIINQEALELTLNEVIQDGSIAGLDLKLNVYGSDYQELRLREAVKEIFASQIELRLLENVSEIDSDTLNLDEVVSIALSDTIALTETIQSIEMGSKDLVLKEVVNESGISSVYILEAITTEGISLYETIIAAASYKTRLIGFSKRVIQANAEGRSI